MLAVKQPAHQSIATCLQHYEMLHKQQSATVLLWDKLAKEKRWKKLSPNSDKQLELFEQQHCFDRFVSVNEFHGWRLISLLAKLCACYIDIDSRTTTLEQAQQALQDAKLPPPSAVMYSGNGLHLYWLHEPVPASKLPQWQQMQKQFFKALSPLGADAAALDCTRVLRLAGTVNSKNLEQVFGQIFDPEPWTFDDLVFEVLPAVEEKPKKARIRDLGAARAERGHKPGKSSIYARWHLVFQDLLTIARYHHGIPEGYRNVWLHLAATSLSWFATVQTIEDELTYHAKTWTPDISDRELADVLSQPLKRAQLVKALQERNELSDSTEQRYRYKRETLYLKLKPLIPAELEQQLRAIVSTETKQGREKQRLAARDRTAEGRYKKAHKDATERQKPWDALGISRATYYRRKASKTS